MSNAIDLKVTELFNVLNKKKQEFEEAEATSNKKWITNCSFPSVFGTAQPINIQVQPENVLVELLTELLIHQEYARKASELLSVKPKDINWGGFTIEQWIEDFKTRAAKIQLSTRKNELIQLEKRLDAVVSPEQRRAMELEALAKELEL